MNQPKKKVHSWPIAIIITLVIFAAFIVTIAVYLSNKNFDLVSEDYYMESVNFDQVFDAKKAASELGEKPAIGLDQESKYVVVGFPASYSNDVEDLVLKFFKPDDASQDFEAPVPRASGQNFKISYKDLKLGEWKVSTYWKMHEKQYIIETDVLLK